MRQVAHFNRKDVVPRNRHARHLAICCRGSGQQRGRPGGLAGHRPAVGKRVAFQIEAGAAQLRAAGRQRNPYRQAIMDVENVGRLIVCEYIEWDVASHGVQTVTDLDGKDVFTHHSKACCGSRRRIGAAQRRIRTFRLACDRPSVRQQIALRIGG